jgi:hypothetical protein
MGEGGGRLDLCVDAFKIYSTTTTYNVYKRRRKSKNKKLIAWAGSIKSEVFFFVEIIFIFFC